MKLCVLVIALLLAGCLSPGSFSYSYEDWQEQNDRLERRISEQRAAVCYSSYRKERGQAEDAYRKKSRKA